MKFIKKIILLSFTSSLLSNSAYPGMGYSATLTDEDLQIKLSNDSRCVVFSEIARNSYAHLYGICTRSMTELKKNEATYAFLKNEKYGPTKITPFKANAVIVFEGCTLTLFSDYELQGDSLKISANMENGRKFKESDILNHTFDESLTYKSAICNCR